jgi:hypothetical protein
MIERKSGYDPATGICWQFRNKGTEKGGPVNALLTLVVAASESLSFLAVAVPTSVGSGARAVFHFKRSN